MMDQLSIEPSNPPAPPFVKGGMKNAISTPLPRLDPIMTILKTPRPRDRRRRADRPLLGWRRSRPRLEWMEDRTLLSTFLVSNIGDSGPGSLRQAILDSNDAVGATNTIDFAISGSGVQTIFPLSTLPAVSNPVLIDGFSQPGYAGTPLIELNGSQAGGGDGLTITGSGVTVRGLDIDLFGTVNSKAPAFTSRARAPRVIGSTATSWAPIRLARWP